MTSSANAQQGLLRRLRHEDAARCVELATNVGWDSNEAVWQTMFDLGEPLVIELGGELAGTVIANRFGDALAMTVVGVAYRRQGVGRRLMEAALRHALPGVVFLFATEMGKWSMQASVSSSRGRRIA